MKTTTGTVLRSLGCGLLPSTLCGLCLLVVPTLVGSALVGCRDATHKAPAKGEPPAKVVLLPHETELATVTLTAEAVERLAIKTVAVEQRSVARHRTFAGEAVVPSGKSIVVAAPVAGVVSGVGESFPRPGRTVQVAQPLMIVRPLLSPERDVLTPAETVQIAGTKATLVSSLVTTQGEVQRGESEVAGLKINRDRAQKLLADRAGSRRALDDAVAQLQIAEAVLTASKLRETELTTLLQSLDTASAGDAHQPASPLTITSPMGGIVRNVSVSVDQTVNAGTPLFEVVNLDSIWIRVPIYVDLLAGLRTAQEAALVALDGRPFNSTASSPGTAAQFMAQPVAAPPTADAASSSADLYYVADNQSLHLRPGQRVGVDLSLDSLTEALIVPNAAVLYDIYGGTWVYVQQANAGDSTAESRATMAGDSTAESRATLTSGGDTATRFVRERVILEWVDGDQAVVSQGPAVGEKVVTDGAAELFGTEFGAGK